MKKLFEGASPPPRPPAGARAGEPMVAMHDRHGTTSWLTTKEAAAAGYREVANPEGVRIVQFGLCRDDRGEWVYPPFRTSDETLDEMLERNAEARARVKRCPTKRASSGERRYE